MQNQDVMVAPQNWPSFTTNTTMESWMGATYNVDYAIANGFDGFQNLSDQPSYRGPTIFTPVPLFSEQFNDYTDAALGGSS
jgi:hypothetical protein